ncbi:unnamed protein product [Effrenium voratum]|uniref:RNA helicase n=1 Tax=Effrenium voratum TaxID=2562239 RepID=A0AA36I8Q2_9DINO|nr:unnamed protein product [Effrenium voratum]
MSWSRGWQQDEWKSKSWEESTEVQDPWSNYGKAQDAGNWGSHKQDDWHGREDASWKQEQDPWGAWKKSGKDDWKEQDPWSRGRNDKENDPWSRSRNDKDVWGGYKNSCDDRQDNSWSRFSSSRDDRQDAWGQSRDDRQDSWGRQREVKEDPWGSYQKDSYQKDSYQKDSYGKDSWSRSDRQEDNRWSQDQGGWDKDGSQDRWGKAQDSWSRNDRQEDNSWSRNDRQEDSWSKNDGQEDPWGSYGRQDGQDNSWSNAKKDSWGTTTTGWTAREAYAGKLLEVDWAARPPMVEVKKNFYGEGFANVLATQRSDEEAQEIRRAANISIEHGESEAHPVPNPINSFDEACFDAELMGKITEQNFKEPTPVQKQIWPLAMQGRDVVGIAETGSGKTIAYLLPMIVHITYQSELQAGDGPVGLVLAPTRELAKQIKEECDTYASLKGLVTENVVGGIEKWDQKRRIQEKNDIIVATPGRFMQALDEEWIQLNRTSFVVLDEADEMLRKDFSEQIQKILGQVRRERQVLMFSATWPEEVENLAQQICTASEGMPPVYVRIGENKMAACRYIEQMTVVVDGEEDKYEKLLDSLKKSESIGSDKAIIFCRSRSTVQTLVDKLKEDEFFWEEGKCKVEALHGEMKQMDRDWVMQQFRKEDLPLVVSTGVLARGHDIPKVRFVFNYDLPREPEDYIHRVGRTGRAGAKGYAKTFVDRKSWKEMESACSFLKTVFQNTSQTIEPDFQELIDNYDNANQEWPAEAVQDGQAWSGEAAEAWSGEATQQEWSGEAAQQAEAWSGEATQQEWSGEAAQQAEAWSGEATQQEWSGEAAQQAEAWSGEATQQEWSGVAQQAEAWSGEATQQVEQEQEPTDEEPVNDPASSGLEWSSDKHLPTSDELIELSKEQQEAILGGSGDLSFNMSPWIRALVSIVYDFNEGLPQYCAEQVLVLSNCVPAEFQQTLQHQTTKQGASWRDFICSLQKTTPVTKNPVLLKFRGKRVEEEVLSSQSKLLGIGYSLLGAALDAWAVAAGHDSKFWEASDVFLMIANCQAIKREQSLRKDVPDSKFRILRKMVDGKEVLAFRVVPTAARQFDNPTVSQYYNGNSVKLHRAVVQSQSSHNPQQQPAKRQRQGFPVEPWSCLPAWRSGWHYGWHSGDHSEWEAGWQDRQPSVAKSQRNRCQFQKDAVQPMEPDQPEKGRWRKAAAAQAEEERRAATEATEATDAQEPTATSAAEVAAWQAQAATSAADEAAWQGQTSATAVDEAAWQEQAASDAAWQAQAQAQAAQAQVWNGESEEAWASAGDWNQADVVRAQAVTTWTAEAGDPAWEMAQWQGVSWETYCGNAMYYYDQWQHERNSQWTAGAEEGQGTWPGPATVEAEPFVLATDDVGEVIKVPEEAKAVENGAEVPEATADAKAPASEAAADATQAEEIAASKASDAAAVAVEASEAVPEATEAPMDALAPHPPEALEVLAALVKASGPPPGLEGEKDDLKEFEGFWDGSEGATAAAPEVQSAGCPVISIDQDPPKRDSQETEPKAEAEAEQAQCPEGTALEKTEETEAVSEVDAEKATEVPDAEVEESGKAVPEVDAEKGSEDPKDEPLAVAASWQ